MNLSFHVQSKFPPADLFSCLNFSLLCFWSLNLIYSAVLCFSVEKICLFLSVASRRGNAIFNNPPPLLMEISIWKKEIQIFMSTSSRAYNKMGENSPEKSKQNKTKKRKKCCLLHQMVLRIRQNSDPHIPFSPPRATKPPCLSQEHTPHRGTAVKAADGVVGVGDRKEMMWACCGDVLLNHSLPSSQSACSGVLVFGWFFAHHREDHTDLKHWKP